MEEIELDYVGPITGNNRRFYSLLSIAWFSNWPAASFCTSTDRDTAVRFKVHKQYIQLTAYQKRLERIKPPRSRDNS